MFIKDTDCRILGGISLWDNVCIVDGISSDTRGGLTVQPAIQVPATREHLEGPAHARFSRSGSGS